MTLLSSQVFWPLGRHFKKLSLNRYLSLSKTFSHKFVQANFAKFRRGNGERAEKVHLIGYGSLNAVFFLCSSTSLWGRCQVWGFMWWRKMSSCQRCSAVHIPFCGLERFLRLLADKQERSLPEKSSRKEKKNCWHKMRERPCPPLPFQLAWTLANISFPPSTLPSLPL